MIQLFRYNWIVRDDWFELCNQLSIEQLTLKRIGGPGSILYTLFHIVDVEYSWIRGIQGKPDIQVQFEDYLSLQQVKALSDSWNKEMREYLDTWKIEFDHEQVTIPWNDGHYTKGEIMRHVIAHEIHHMGQLSVWIRELGLKPVSANVIGKNLS
ncbi:DinB family protein [Paenibacillus sp. MCAF9]|uniref:DinB family protein n=1 Tax=Paenibacillus sp. MCAF9 TaxID=3233046 RepID=UPI003F988BEB